MKQDGVGQVLSRNPAILLLLSREILTATDHFGLLVLAQKHLNVAIAILPLSCTKETLDLI